MGGTILRTKIYKPPLRPDLVLRPHLIERLNQSLQIGHKLTLISAPAGFGKTTLVSEWGTNLQQPAAQESRSETRIAWLSLEDGDNEPARFLAYLIAAINHVLVEKEAIGLGVLRMQESTAQTPPLEMLMTALINDAEMLTNHMLIILDDYHNITPSPVDEVITFLLEHLPLHLHLVISTREDPQLPLARFRARGELTELRASDLRFSSTEAAEFLNQVMGLNLLENEIEALEARTEGWIAGLQLAALTLQDPISMQRQQDNTGLIKSFSGSHRFVLDYLLEEVLEKQPITVQDFLLQTAVLNRLTGSLCDALTGQEDGQVTIEQLEHDNLFIVPLDEERRWYRYHHLFADLLRKRLRQTRIEQVTELHQRASAWYEKNDYIDEAIEHAQQAKDSERAARLIEEFADAIWRRGEHVKLRRWLNALPAEQLLSRPHLCIFHAWYLFAGGQQEAAVKMVDVAERTLENSVDYIKNIESREQGRLRYHDISKLRGRAATIRSFMATYTGDVPAISKYARQALEYLPEEELTWRGSAAISLGDAKGFMGDMNAAYQARLEAAKACRAAGDIYFSMIAHLKLAITLRAQGRLQPTIELCRQQKQLADEWGFSHTAAVGWLLAIWGEVLAELNDLEGALYHVQKGVEMTEHGGEMAMRGWSYICLARVLFSSSDIAGVKAIIQKMATLDRESDVPPWITNHLANWQVRLWLSQDKLDSAYQWIGEHKLNFTDEVEPPSKMDYYSLFDHIMLSRILLAQDRLHEATRLLRWLMEPVEKGGRTSRLIEILLLLALAYQADNDSTQAMIALERALTLAKPLGFIRIFVDEGLPMTHLLRNAVNQGIELDYGRQLLLAFPVKELELTDTNKSKAQELIEPLSKRELEVLRLIANGLTNREIASRLFLSLNTVKVHVRNIYGKLNTHNRTQTVAKARRLGILPLS